MPINLIPVFDWITADANYNATYNWTRGTDQEDGQSLGNVISNNRTLNINGALNFEKLYNHIPFLKKANERFNKRTNNATKKKRDGAKSPKEANEARRNLKERRNCRRTRSLLKRR